MPARPLPRSARPAAPRPASPAASPAASPPAPRRAAKRASRLALLAATLALAAGCAGPNYYGEDAKPHPAVVRARTSPIQGIDVSKWQGSIDWASVRGAGTQFAFIKATEGGDHLDERFRENWAGARQAGVFRGAYHFMFWCRSAADQATWFRRNVPNEPDALPPVLDLEWNGESRTCPHKIPREKALAEIKLMLQAMEEHTGKRPIIYTDITFHRDILEGELEDYPHWVRSTAAEPQERYANRRWMLWQYTTTGRIAGVRGNVDRNAFYGTHAEWASFLATDCDPREHRRLSAQGLCTEK